MTHFLIPPEERRPWPTLGAEVCAWQEANLAFGPGDLRGQPYRLDIEDRGYMYAAYEVNPPDHPGLRCKFERGRCRVGRGTCGRRRFQTAVFMLRKGLKKSERGGAMIAVELALDGPVRCDGFRREHSQWVPIGRPVTDPYIPVVAYSEKQATDTSFVAATVMIGEGPGADLFDVSQDRVKRARGEGKAEALSTSPDSRDGARTTFQVKEETHRWTLPRQLEASNTMTANLAKRPIADPWEVHLTTAYTPGEGSLAEKMHDAALDEAAKPDRGRSSRLYFYYRFADPAIDTSTSDGLLEAIDDASGQTALTWSDTERIASQWTMPGADLRYLERTWLNRTAKSTAQAFDVQRWKELLDEGHSVEPGATIVLAWHGARYWDAAALIATEVLTGYQWAAGIWQRAPNDGDDWEVPEHDVTAALADVFGLYNVWRLAVHPDRWESSAAEWARTYGEDRVRAWRANAWTEMSRAVRAYSEAIRAGEVHHPDDPRFDSHLGAAQRRYLDIRDEDGQRVWVPGKEGQDSPHPVNAAIAAVISWQARLDALRDGAGAPMVWTAV